MSELIYRGVTIAESCQYPCVEMIRKIIEYLAYSFPTIFKKLNDLQISPTDYYSSEYDRL